MKRRTLMNAAGAAIVAGAAGGSIGAAVDAAPGEAGFVPAAQDQAVRGDVVQSVAAQSEAAAGWQLRWSPAPNVDGLGAFEGVEDDRADSHPAGQPHIFVEGDHYRFNMHLVDRDTMTDRQRQEVKGMVTGGANLILDKGEIWKLAHQVYIPTSLKATTSFTHIMQTKAPGTGTLPMIVMSLRRLSGVEKVELVAGGTRVGAVDLVPLKNKWIDVELEMTIGDASTGRVRWVLRDGATTVVDVARSNVDIWLEDRVRPKWGIYRSLGDTSGSLRDCFMYTRNHQAYEWTGTTPTEYQAEAATISQGVVESNHAGFTGSGFVNLNNVTGSYVEFTVAGPVSKVDIRYANGTTANRPMSVNGVTVDFPPTANWDTWAVATMPLSLGSGSQTIRLTSITSTGGPNLDKITVS